MTQLSYEEKKAKLCAEVKRCAEEKQASLALYKESSNLFRNRSREKNERRIDVRDFNRVIYVDADNYVAEVEGMTTYEDLVNETLKFSRLPTVVPELKSITIGGALAGCGIESSSFRYGLVHETILEMEILLSDGRVVVCNPFNEHRDLFYAFPNTFGTLGYALKVKVKLIPTKPFVKLNRIHFSDPGLFFKEMGRICTENRFKGDVDYLDAVIFSPNEMYLNIGQFVDRAPFASRYDYMQIYYKSIQTKTEDYLRTKDYIWRWDPDWFWCSKVFGMQNPVMRLLFGKWMLKSRVYTKIMHFMQRHPALTSLYTKLDGKKESVIQDVLVPLQHSMEFFEFFKHEIDIKPVWICPTQPYSSQARYDFCSLDPETLYVDFGFWDMLKTDQEEGYYNRKIERKVADLKGFKSLYSSSYYTQEEFWKLFDPVCYQNIKEKYDPNHILKGLYQKCAKRNNT